MVHKKLAAAGLGAAATFVLANVAFAQGFPQLRGSIGAEYSRAFASSGGDDANVWSGNGDIVVGLGNSGLNFQGNASYGYFDPSLGTSIDTWNVAGSLFWRGSRGLLGATGAM